MGQFLHPFANFSAPAEKVLAGLNLAVQRDDVKLLTDLLNPAHYGGFNAFPAVRRGEEGGMRNNIGYKKPLWVIPAGVFSLSRIPAGKIFPTQELSALRALTGELHHLK